MGVSAGVLTGLTVTFRVLALAHCPAFGVKVSEKVPLPAVAGLKVLPPVTPGPDQLPRMPSWVVLRPAGASLAQKGPMGVRVGRLGIGAAEVGGTCAVHYCHRC
jgi:hypothetical protein